MTSTDGTQASIRTALLWQLIAGLAGVIPAVLLFGLQLAVSLGFGVLISMLNTVMLGRRIHDAAMAEPEAGQRMLYAGAVKRFVLVLTALVLAYFLTLHLFAVAVGMLLAQVAVFAFAAGSLKDQFRRG